MTIFHEQFLNDEKAKAFNQRTKSFATGGNIILYYVTATLEQVFDDNPGYGKSTFYVTAALKQVFHGNSGYGKSTFMLQLHLNRSFSVTRVMGTLQLCYNYT